MATSAARERPESGSRRSPLQPGPPCALGSGALRVTCRARLALSRRMPQLRVSQAGRLKAAEPAGLQKCRRIADGCRLCRVRRQCFAPAGDHSRRYAQEAAHATSHRLHTTGGKGKVARMVCGQTRGAELHEPRLPDARQLGTASPNPNLRRRAVCGCALRACQVIASSAPASDSTATSTARAAGVTSQ